MYVCVCVCVCVRYILWYIHFVAEMSLLLAALVYIQPDSYKSVCVCVCVCVCARYILWYIHFIAEISLLAASIEMA